MAEKTQKNKKSPTKIARKPAIEASAVHKKKMIKVEVTQNETVVTAITVKRKKTEKPIKKPVEETAPKKAPAKTGTINPVKKVSKKTKKTKKANEATTKKPPEKEPTQVKSAPKEDEEGGKKLTKDTKKQPRFVLLKRFLASFGRILLSILLIVGTSYLLAWLLIDLTNMGDLTPTEFVEENFGIFMWNWAVIAAATGVLAAILWRPVLAIAIMTSIIKILGYANEQKYNIQAAPVFPEDFNMIGDAGTMMQLVDKDGLNQLILGVIILITEALIIEFLLRLIGKKARKALPLWRRWALIQRVVLTALALYGLIFLIDAPLKKQAPLFVDEIDYVEWNRPYNYKTNGFLLGFLTAMPEKITMPEEYSQARIEEIAKKYQALKKADDANRTTLDQKVDNFIIILDESFTDPELFLEEYPHSGGDVVPNLHQIMSNYPSGYMFSTVYGGGTSNVEFEVQTGLSNFWYRGLPYSDALVFKKEQLAAPTWAKKFGFETTFIHSFSSELYDRKKVYSIFGVDKQIYQDDFEHRQTENASSYINDQAAFMEVLDELQNGTGQKMITVTTMQNHSPYNAAAYEQLHFWIQSDKDMDAKTEEELTLIESSWESIHMADEYLGEFIEALETIDKRTVVLWFGDHAPGVLNEYVDVGDQTTRRKAQLTPYFIYANFEIESPYTVDEIASMREDLEVEIAASKKILDTIDLPLMTPNCLLNEVYDILKVQKPSIFYLINEVCRETPILSATYWGNRSVDDSDTLKEYELVNYDQLAGGKYWNGE